VTKTPQNPQPNSPVTYSVDVKNVGTTTDPGPLNVKVTIPPGGTIESVKPAPGWTCVQQDRTVLCNRPMALPPGETSRAVDIVVRNPGAVTPDNAVNAKVSSEGAIDPNPADNVWNELGSNLRIAGGGIGCSLTPVATNNGAGLLAGIGAAMVALALLRRRSSQRTDASARL